MNLSEKKSKVLMLTTLRKMPKKSQQENVLVGTPQQPTYVYKQLDNHASQIRVLSLLPANSKNEDIRCTLENVSMSCVRREVDAFEALSYVWGTSELEAIIEVDGHPFPVTKNLKVALTHLRYTSQPRRLWIDAICIDQADVKERSSQVGLMRHIYAYASRVLVWLGCGDRDTDSVIQFFADCAERNHTVFDQPDEELRPLIPGVVKLVKSPWWSRIWVVQEFIVASRAPLVICGHSQISWKDFQLQMLTVNMLSPTLGDWFPTRIEDSIIAYLQFNSVPTAYSHHSMEQRINMKVSMRDVLSATANRHATDPRDKVFAVLGLLPDDYTTKMRADYSKSVSEVYQAATADMLSTGDNLELLWRNVTNDRRVDLPSWCVDLETNEWNRFGQSFGQWHPFSRDAGFEADRGTTRGHIVHDPAANSISLEGLRIGAVATVIQSSLTYAFLNSYKNSDMNGASESDHTASGTDFLMKVLGDAMRFNLRANVALSTRLPEDDAWIMLAKGTAWRTMNAGRPCNKPYTDISEGERQHLNLTDDYWLLEKLLQEKSNDLYRAVSTPWKAPKRDVPLPDVDSWIINQMYVMKDQLTETTFFTTENGYIGSSATAIEEGDVICILFGSKVPAVLRPQGHKYRLVSFAYVDGIMNGELTRDETQAASKKERFEII